MNGESFQAFATNESTSPNTMKFSDGNDHLKKKTWYDDPCHDKREGLRMVSNTYFRSHFRDKGVRSSRWVRTLHAKVPRVVLMRRNTKAWALLTAGSASFAGSTARKPNKFISTSRLFAANVKTPASSTASSASRGILRTSLRTDRPRLPLRRNWEACGHCQR